VRDPRERLRDVLEAIERIERYAARGRDAFEGDELIQSWFVRHLQIIGEAARTLPQDVRNHAPEIPWPKIVGMRHILVHDYFEIDAGAVWEAVERDIPELKRHIQAMLETLDEQT
jgi:uncharacterized protein with HEPN domain